MWGNYLPSSKIFLGLISVENLDKLGLTKNDLENVSIIDTWTDATYLKSKE